MSLAMTAICGFLPQAIISPFGGMLADRYNRKHLSMFADSCIAIATLGLFFYLMTWNNNLKAIYFCAFIRSIGAGIQTPTVNAMVPQIAGKDNLLKVNALFTSIYSILGIAAPVCAGIMLAKIRFEYVLLVDVFTALIGVGIFAFIKLPPHEKALSKIKSKPFDDFKEGFKFSFSDPFIRRFIVIFSMFSFAIVIPSRLNILLINRVFGGYEYLVANEIAYFAGGGLGGILLAKWKGFKNKTRMWALGFYIFGITTIGIGVVPIFWIYALIILICGLSMPLCNGVPYAILQRYIKDENLYGRVFGILDVVSNLAFPLGMAILGPVADYVDIRFMTVISGFALIAIGIFTRFSKVIYNNTFDDNVSEKEKIK
jgi:DHA3 family macrolide efflux protein-like MFS transporter